MDATPSSPTNEVIDPSTSKKKKRNRGKNRRPNKKKRKKKTIDNNIPPIAKDVVEDLKKSIPKYKQSATNAKEELLQYQERLKWCAENDIKPTVNTEPGFPMPLIDFCNTPGFTLDSCKLPYDIDLSLVVNSITWPTSMLLSDELIQIISDSKVKLTQTNQHKRLCKALSGPALLKGYKSQHYIRFLDDGSWDLIVLKDLHPTEQSVAEWPVYKEYHLLHSKGLAKGCNASDIPSVEWMRYVLKNARILKGFGVMNATKILKIAPAKVGSANAPRMYYINAQGKEISWQFSQWIDYHPMSVAESKKQFYQSDLLQRARSYWLALAGASFANEGISPKHYDMLMCMACNDQFMISGTNFQDNGNSKPRLVHTDPYSAFLTICQGSTVFKVNERGEWVKQCNGGELVMVNGYHFVDYSPTDMTFIKPSSLHGVATLSSFTGDNASLMRYSHTMSCKYNRGIKCKSMWEALKV